LLTPAKDTHLPFFYHPHVLIRRAITQMQVKNDSGIIQQDFGIKEGWPRASQTPARDNLT
jgi:hypothetical protein